MPLQPSYYAVIFSSNRSNQDDAGYNTMADRMIELAQEQKGFLGIESTRGPDGFGITVSYWETSEDIMAWKANAEHKIAQKDGRSKWYESFKIKVCKVEREYEFSAPTGCQFP